MRPAVARVPVYKPGKPPAAIAGDLVAYKLSSNENPYPPLPGVLEATARAVAQMNRYPDMGNAALTAALSTRLGVAPDRLAFGTGSVAVLYHLLQAVLRGRRRGGVRLAQLRGVPDRRGHHGRHGGAGAARSGRRTRPWRDARRDHGRPRAVLLCTPNNPTGPALRHADVVAFLDAVPEDVLVVVDEAYVEFVTDPDRVRGLDLVAERGNVVVLRTFSKAYGLAGFRVGYCVAAPEIASAMRAVALPFGVSVPAQAAVVASLEAEPALLERVDHLVRAREELVSGLRDLGFAVPEAQGNFVWLPAGPGTHRYAEAFGAAALSVRPYAAGDDQDGIRITVGEPEANALVLEVAATLANRPET